MQFICTVSKGLCNSEVTVDRKKDYVIQTFDSRQKGYMVQRANRSNC